MKSGLKYIIQKTNIFLKKNRVFSNFNRALSFFIYVTLVVILMNFSDVLSKPNKNMKDKLLKKYITTFTKDDSVTNDIFLYSKKYNLDYELIFAIIKSESNFNQKYIKKNSDNSYDVGLCAINNFKVKVENTSSLLNSSNNINIAAKILASSINKNKKNIVKSLATYRKLTKNIKTEKVGKSTLKFIQTVLNEKKNIENQVLIFFEENSELL